MCPCCCSAFFFFNDTPTPAIYTLSLHDALPILSDASWDEPAWFFVGPVRVRTLFLAQFADNVFHERDLLLATGRWRDRKSTRLNSSHPSISYAVFCLKKKKTTHVNADYVLLSVF